jgi:AcrR family transcriptional regulator
VFARRGYHAASMDEIALEADISKPMLYAYFGSKEGLYVAYIGRTGRELLDRLVGAGGAAARPMARLRARVTEFLAFVEEHQDGWRVLFGELSSNGPVVEEVSDLRGQIAQAVRRMLEEGAPARVGLSAPSSEGIAHAIVGAGESLANWWLEHPEISREQLADWYVRLIGAAVEADAASRADGGYWSSSNRSSPITGDSLSEPIFRIASNTPGMNDSRSIES